MYQVGVNTEPLLAIENVVAGYGKSRIIDGLSLEVNHNDRVCILGGNGSGKSTLLKCIMGLLQHQDGTIQFDGSSLLGIPAHRRFHCGITMIPQDRRLFLQKTVEQNLDLGVLSTGLGKTDISARKDDVLDQLPLLREVRHQKTGFLSGGQQQLVALGRALMARPRLLLLDEPSAGLSPIWIETLYETLQQLSRSFALTYVLVEQNVFIGLDLTDRAYVLRNGTVSLNGTSAELARDENLIRSYLG
jgi:branched-chain amino acid transport system ATP-binding protein